MFTKHGYRQSESSRHLSIGNQRKGQPFKFIWSSLNLMHTDVPHIADLNITGFNCSFVVQKI